MTMNTTIRKRRSTTSAAVQMEERRSRTKYKQQNAETMVDLGSSGAQQQQQHQELETSERQGAAQLQCEAAQIPRTVLQGQRIKATKKKTLTTVKQRKFP